MIRAIPNTSASEKTTSQNGWMAGLLIAILRPLKQYFSHIRTMGDDKKLSAIEPCLR